MTMFYLQSALLLAIAFVIGCIIGCLLRRLFSKGEVGVPAAAATAASVVTATGLAMRQSPEAAMEEIPQEAPEPAPIAEVSEQPIIPPVTEAAPTIVKSKATAKNDAPSAASFVSKPVKPDDLKLIVGIGPVNERKLHALEVTRFAQIAAWSPQDEEEYGNKMEFPGRIEREEWVRQAKNLVEGGQSEDASELARGKGAAKSAKSVITSKDKKETPVKKPIAAKLAKPIGGKPDNLTLIDGIGNVIESKLNEMGVFHFEQIANWTTEQAETLSAAVGFKGRALREGWVAEAAIFAKGGTTDHAKKVEAGKITTSRTSSPAEKGDKKS